MKQLLNTLLFDYRFFIEREEQKIGQAPCQTPSPSNRFIGGHSEEDPPVPIPNTEVKLFSADGTAWVTVWESRSPPIFFS
jgi:hypothetical protein